MKLKFHISIKHILLISLLLWLPLLTIRGLFWDSWVIFWDYTNGGILRLFDIVYQVGHAGWIIPYSFFFKIGESYTGELGRSTAIIFHLINSYLFYLILHKNKIWKEFALLASAIYTLSPFYTARISINLAPYDLFIACYLGSILLMHRSRIISKIIGYLLLIISFSWETLMAFEILRIIYLYEGQKDWRSILKKVYPAWLLCIIFAILRFTILKPHGIYEGYNSVSLSMFLHLPEHIIDHLKFYIEMLGWNVKIVANFLTGSILFIFTSFLFCSNKWAIYDDLIKRDMQRQLQYYSNLTLFTYFICYISVKLTEVI